MNVNLIICLCVPFLLVFLMVSVILSSLMVDSLIAVIFAGYLAVNISVEEGILLCVRAVLQVAFSIVDRVGSWARFFGAVILALVHTILLRYLLHLCDGYLLPSLIISWMLVVPELWAYGTRNGYRKIEDAFLSRYSAKWKRKYARGVSYLEVSPGDPLKPSVDIVLLPGYGHGKGFMMPVAERLADEVNARVFALDPPGSGMSYPEFTMFRTIAQCESWMTSRLERWRKAVGLNSLILGGHSMGGYFGSVWALRHPQIVKQVILISPAGVPEEPLFTARSLGFSIFYKFALLTNLTPQTILRLCGPFAEMVCYKGYVHRRYAKRQIDISSNWDLWEYAKYLAHYNTKPKSYENVLHKVFYKGLLANDPLYHRLLEGNVKCVDFIYGEKDWMAPDVGVALSMCLSQTSKSSTLKMIEDAYHQLPIEKPEQLSIAICELCKLRHTQACSDVGGNDL